MAAGGINPVQLEETFKIKKDVYTVTITDNQLKWESSKNQKIKGGCIDIADIISVKEVGPEKYGWILSYAMRKKDNILKRTVLKFEGNEDASAKIIAVLNEKISNLTLRPKRMLVFVNPISGSSNGRKVMEKQLVPIFKEANIHMDIIVTERAHHTEEVLATYDLTTIDCIVLLGGDGMYHEVADGLLKRLARDASLDLNDPNTIMPEAKIPIGIIPCGTGNGIAFSCNGNYDRETAILSVMIGKRGDNNVFGVYCDGKLVTISVLLVGYGFWGDIIYISENRRNMGVFRYPATMFEYMLVRSVRTSVCRVEYRTIKTEDDPAAKETENENPEWSQVEGRYSGVIALSPSDMFANNSEFSQRMDCSRIICSKPVGRLQMFSLLINLMLYKRDMIEGDTVTAFRAKEYRLSLQDDLAEEGSALRNKQLVLNIDGDVYKLTKPQFNVKIHSRKLHLYTNVSEDWFHKKFIDKS